MPPEFGRDTDRLLVLELKRELEPDEVEPPDAAAELADAVTALRLATAGAIAAGPVVFERLDYRPLRDRAVAPDRGDAAARRCDPARRGARPARGRPARAAAARRRGPRARRGARPLGALALLRGAVPLRAGARGACVPARRRRRDLGRVAPGRRPPRREGRRAGRGARRASAPSSSTGSRATRCAACSSRRCCTVTAAELVAAVDETLIGLRPRPSSVLRVA